MSVKILSGMAATTRILRCELVAVRNSVKAALAMPGALDEPEAETLAVVCKRVAEAIEAIDMKAD